MNVMLEGKGFLEVVNIIQENIKNPVEKEIVIQIIQKVKEFVDNLDQIKHDIDSSFPSLMIEK